jgi:hypothetical protein
MFFLNNYKYLRGDSTASRTTLLRLTEENCIRESAIMGHEAIAPPWAKTAFLKLQNTT